jgi:UDP-N-acetylglucosamine acyltransferase
MKIHPSAMIAKGAVLGSHVEVGPYCVIGAHVSIGSRTKILSHVVIDGFTEIGEGCVIYPGASLGLPPQDKKFKDCKSFLKIGDRNVIREHVTMNPGSAEGSATVLGNDNLLMVASHVAHDCVVGSGVVLANTVALAGHVVVEDQAVIGGLAGVHQFTRMGKLSMTGGLSKVVMDVPPFSMCDGHPASVRGVNAIGLKRAGFASKEILQIKKALKILYAAGGRRLSAIEKLKKQFKGNKDVAHLAYFAEHSERGLCRMLSKSEID